MTSRERVQSVFNYEQPDKCCFDLMDGTIWDELAHYFSSKYRCETKEDVLSMLDCDFRWSHMYKYNDVLEKNKIKWESPPSFSDSEGNYLLADAHTSEDVDKLFDPDPYEKEIPDFKAMREEYPDKALVFCTPGMHMFSKAAELFGIQETMVKMMVEPEVFKTFAIKQRDWMVSYLERAINAGVTEYCDFFWAGDDFASDDGLMISPDLWRNLVRPYMEPVIRLAKEKGLKTLFHSCGSVSCVYSDFIDMGIDAHAGVQTSAKDMDIEYLAKNYGGRMVIFGGVDAQTTLVECTPEQVIEETKKNRKAFENCGGYIVANGHHSLPDMRSENIVAMAIAADRNIEIR